MRILFVRANQGMPDSRVEKEIYSLSKEHTVELLGWDRTQNCSNLIEKKVNISGKQVQFYHVAIEAPQGEGFKKILIPMIKFWIQIRKFIVKNATNYDVIHFCDFDTAALAFFKTRRLGIKIVYDIFDYYADSHSAPTIIRNAIKYMENYIIEHSDAVILCSEARVEQIRPAKPKRLAIIHNSPSTEITMESIEIKGEQKRKRLVYVGMLSEERYLREMAEVIIARKDIEWHIGGFGLLESYFIDLARQSDNIFFYGKLKYSQTLFLESKCDIMSAIYNPNIPNHKYAAPNKFYEALMLGKPVIMAEGTGMDEVVFKNEIGAVLRNGDFKNEFDIAINKLIYSNTFMEIEEKCKKIYCLDFSWKEMESRLLKLYRTV